MGATPSLRARWAPCDAAPSPMPTGCGWPKRPTRPAIWEFPFVFFVASSGADVLDGVAALHGWGRAAAAIARCSGQVPVITVATGPVVSGPALLLGLSDLVVMNSEAVAFVSGPQMVAEFTGIDVGITQLGGTAMHATASGLCAVQTDDVDGAVAELLEYLPSNTDEIPPRHPSATRCSARHPSCAPSSPIARRRRTTPGTCCGRSATTASSGSSGRAGPASWSPPSPAWAVCRSASWPTSPGSWPEPSTLRHRRRGPASSASAMPSTCRSSVWSIRRDSYPGRTWNGAA